MLLTRDFWPFPLSVQLCPFDFRLLTFDFRLSTLPVRLSTFGFGLSTFFFLLAGPVAFCQSVDLSVDDHLEPEVSYLAEMNHNTEYYAAVRETLLSQIGDSPLARVVVLPTIAPEYAVSVEQNRKTQACVLVWTLAKRSILNDNNREDIPATVARVPISQELAKKLGILFRMSTAEVGYLKNKVWGTDGTTYHCSSFVVGDGIRAGYCWAPRPGSKMHSLVQITELMVNFVKQNGSPATTQALAAKCETFYKRLKS
jgi:hypothetical protein